MTPMLTPEYSLIYRLLIKIESIDNFSTEPIFLVHIVIRISVGWNPICQPTYIRLGGHGCLSILPV